MHIVVCIKQVPDTEELPKVKVNPEDNTIVREGVKSIINPFDENALEEALRMKEAKGASVTALSMGPPQAEDAIRKALAMGVDRAILISDPAFAGSDTWATSYILSEAVRKLGKFDIVMTGKQAIDGDTAQVGTGLDKPVPQSSFTQGGPGWLSHQSGGNIHPPQPLPTLSQKSHLLSVPFLTMCAVSL